MTRHLAAVCLAAIAIPCLAQHSAEPALTADAIMARVAVNQDRAEAERVHYVYIQYARVLSRRGSTLMCEEINDSRVTPSASGSDIQLLHLDGRLLHQDQYVTYNTLLNKTNEPPEKDPDEFKGEQIDRHLVENMRRNLTNDKSKDGLATRLFPLTSKNQSGYLFHLIGREHKNGRDVFHIDFRPKEKSEYAWKGDAWIDATDFQPVVVSTALARKVPIVVRTLLGTNISGLGFTIVYASQPDGVWFLVSFGREFKLRVLFFFTRQIVIDAQNRDFEKTHVTSTILPTTAEATPQ
ncbi:hypothetical protein [Edaphobacter albus]|uniref:hypothetical protein n=1 Tax=Edaphobacter sp. 4G125 TaxID=2763071 RepID=UPI0016454948|nr:hypothetical protein [Edaphobacter sp. 4G125]QNI36793.1 hypothetical protein H7846_00125 [Edaphobacter sp. 4G125]